MGSQHGRKPPNPQGAPKSHGRRPSNPATVRKSNGRKPPPPRSNSDDCCPMVAAIRSARRGKFRLARRYAAMSVRLLAERLA